jgi:DNA-binding response OmpR family regulator
MNGRKHILLADDEAGLLFSAGLALRMAGFKVSEAADGKAALDTLLRSVDQGAPVDLLVTDLRMPKLSGAELVSTIRQRKMDVAVFVVSGYFDESVLRELSLAGCEEYMEKPFQLEELVRRVEGILGRKAA